jgi:hypothetical protein
MRGEGELGCVVGGVDIVVVECCESIVVYGVHVVDGARRLRLLYWCMTHV